MSYIGAEQANALVGAWREIVGWQEAGRPSNLHHGPYGGRHYGYRRQLNHGPMYSNPYGAYGYSLGYAPAYYVGGDYATSGYAPAYAEQVYSIPRPQAESYPAHVVGGVADDGYGGSTPTIVERQRPPRTDRITLPMSSGVAIIPNTSAQITSRPQAVAFRPERIIIGGRPSDWVVNDVKVGNRSQFAQSGDVPGEMFAATTIDGFVSMETVQTAMDFVMVVTYVGQVQEGAPFVCGVLGTAAV